MMRQANQSHFESEDEGSINLSAIWQGLNRWKFLVLGISFLAAVIAGVISMTIKNQYRASAVILPIMSPDSSGITGGSTQSNNALASIIGLISGGTSSSTVTFIAILQSRSLARAVIESENLKPHIFPDLWDEAKQSWKTPNGAAPDIQSAVGTLLHRHIQIEQDKVAPTIEIKATFYTPEVAARAANAYLRELQEFINTKSVTVSKSNRIFIEEQLQQAKYRSLEAGKNLANFYQKNRVSGDTSLIDVPIVPADPARPPLVAKQVPQRVYYGFLEMERGVMTNIVSLLESQKELAKIEEQKRNLSFQVIDEALPPLGKFKPNRPFIVLITFMLTLVLLTGSVAAYSAFKP